MKEIIDRIVASKGPATPVLPAQPLPKPAAEPLESKLILLSRTLAGLVDLIIVVCCTGGVLIAADSVSGVDTIDGASLAYFGALLAATYFLYSIFFLFTGNQTIGMMITDLCVVGPDETRPRMGHITRRCVLFLVSLLAAGIGLLWGCFDRESRCLHDLYSGTRVIRAGR